MRVTQSMMYSNMSSNMNRLLGDYMQTNIKSASMKHINRPSDDPAGMVRVMNYRASLAVNEQHQSNSKEASAWLTSTDSALVSTQVLLVKMREKALQATAETANADNRVQIAFEMREILDQIINISNTEFGESHLFSGHKTDEAAYNKILGVSTQNPEMEGVKFDVSGEAELTVMVRFPDDGTLDGTYPVNYEYSKDGGKNWETGATTPPSNTIDAGGVVIEIPEDSPIVKAYDPSIEGNVPTNGTMLYIRPTAEYNGDDNDNPPEVDIFGDSKNNISATTSGHIKQDVRIRFDSDATVNEDGTVKYSYSKDNGLTWEHATATTKEGDDSIRLVIPGGYIDLEVDGTGKIDAGQQMVVRPNRASDIGFEIAPDQFVTVTNSGKDIFGGVHKAKGEDHLSAVEGPNIFETLSNFIVALETNDSSGCGQALEDIKETEKHLLTNLAKVGGKENRVNLNVSLLESNSDDQKSRMSTIEDADLTSLLLTMERQRMSYQSVLQSSSMIMNLSLMNYL